MIPFFGGKGGKSSSNSAIGEKKPPFLEQDALIMYHSIAGKLKGLAVLPKTTDIHEWLATNSLAFFNHINVQVGAISAMCTLQSCPTMTAGKETFEWIDDRKGSKKSTRVPAKQFMDTSLTQIQKQLQDEEVFPTKFGLDFPVEFVSIVRKIFRTFFAILAHIYYHHFSGIQRLGLHDGLNTLFLHFIYFVQHFSLLEVKEYSCMDELITKLIQLDSDLAKNPPVDELESLTIHGHGGPSGGQSSQPSGGVAGNSSSKRDHRPS